MSATRKIQFTTIIGAPVRTVYDTMIDPESYKDWTSAFTEGSYYEGSWEKGERIRFLSPSGDGMLGEIAENRPGDFISIKLLGHILKGVEDTESESVRAWAPAYENYTFQAVPGGTKLVVDQDVTEAYESDMTQQWTAALDRLKALCEASIAH